MKYYKNEENKVFAYELDGSQDGIIPENYIKITDEEAERLSREFTIADIGVLEPIATPTKEELMAKLLQIQQQLESLE